MKKRLAEELLKPHEKFLRRGDGFEFHVVHEDSLPQLFQDPTDLEEFKDCVAHHGDKHHYSRSDVLEFLRSVLHRGRLATVTTEALHSIKVLEVCRDEHFIDVAHRYVVWQSGVWIAIFRHESDAEEYAKRLRESYINHRCY